MSKLTALQKKELSQVMRKPKFIGVVMVMILFAFFGVWASWAPLGSAVIASGSVVVGSSRKTVQHLEGGIISKIFVRDGDVVKKGARLIRLKAASVEARQTSLIRNLRIEKANEVRLLAERNGGKELIFDNKLFAKPDEEMKKIIEEQRQLFKVRMRSMNEKVSILNQRNAQLQSEINGFVSQQQSAREQISLIQQELATVKKLFEQGLEQKPRMLALQRQEAELNGRIGELSSMIAKSREKISENRLNINNLKTEQRNEVEEKLKETKAKIADYDDNLYASSDVFKRTMITAPKEGIVTGLRFKTIGGVIKPGEPILDIVPQDESLVVDAKLNPIDIDVVQRGAKANVLLSAYKTRNIRRIKGDVTHVSPDRFQDESTGEYYFKVTIEIPDSEIDLLKEDVENLELYPGMPAEVFISTGESTLMQYLLSPLRDSMRRAFREQ